MPISVLTWEKIARAAEDIREAFQEVSPIDAKMFAEISAAASIAASEITAIKEEAFVKESAIASKAFTEIRQAEIKKLEAEATKIKEDAAKKVKEIRTEADNTSAVLEGLVAQVIYNKCGKDPKKIGLILLSVIAETSGGAISEDASQLLKLMGLAKGSKDEHIMLEVARTAGRVIDGKVRLDEEEVVHFQDAPAKAKESTDSGVAKSKEEVAAEEAAARAKVRELGRLPQSADKEETISLLTAVVEAKAVTPTKRGLRKVVNFFKHPTVIRVLVIAVAVAFTILSGGATMPLVSLGLVFGTSLISVGMKAWQMYQVDELKLQKAILEGDRLRSQKSKPHKKKLKEQLSDKAMFKTVRDIGLENVAPIVIAGLTFNVLGFLGYTAGLVLGIARVAGYVGFGGYTVRSEFQERVKAERDKKILEMDTKALCEQRGISTFKNTQELVKQLGLEQLPLPTRPSLLTVIINALNPLGVRYKSQDFSSVTEAIKTGKHATPKAHHGRVVPPPTPPQVVREEKPRIL